MLRIEQRNRTRNNIHKDFSFKLFLLRLLVYNINE